MEKPELPSAFARYGGMGFQFVGALLLGAWIGDYADQYFQNKKPVGVLVGLLTGLFLVSVKLIIDLTRQQDK